MNITEARRILAALRTGQPLISRHKAAEALEWALGPRWISVEERMPDGKDSVIAWTTDHGGFAIEVEVFEGMWLIINDERVYNVTHWQPLPAGPGVRDE